MSIRFPTYRLFLLPYKSAIINYYKGGELMELDYAEIGKRIAHRRKELGLRQVQVCERAGINDKYLSCIERATSIPSLEVVMKLALALDTTPDEFLTGSIRYEEDEWRDVAELMRHMNSRQLDLAKNFLIWVAEQKI